MAEPEDDDSALFVAISIAIIVAIIAMWFMEPGQASDPRLWIRP